MTTQKEIENDARELPIDVPERWREWSMEWKLGYLAAHAGIPRDQNPIKGQARYRWPGTSQEKAWDAGHATMSARMIKDRQDNVRRAFEGMSPHQRSRFIAWLRTEGYLDNPTQLRVNTKGGRR